MKNTNIKTLLAAGVILASGFQFSSCKKGEDDPFLSLRSRKARVAGEWTVSSMEETSNYSSTSDDDPLFDDEIVSRTSSSTESFDGSSISMSESDVDTYDGDGFYDKSTSSYNASGSSFTRTTELEYTDGTSVETEEEGDYSSSASYSYTFERDGTFTAEMTSTTTMTSEMSEDAYDMETKTTETETMTISGTWAFLGKNKEDEYKNDERISLWYKTMDYSNSESTEVTYDDKDSDDFIDWEDYNYENSSESNGTQTVSRTEAAETWAISQLKNKEMIVMRDYNYTNSGTNKSSNTSGGVKTTSSSNFNSSSEGTGTMTLTQE